MNIRFFVRAVFNVLVIAVCEGRAVISDVQKSAYMRNGITDALHSSYEFRSEHQSGAICLFQTVFDFICCISEVKRNGQGACLQHTEVNRKPLQTVHHQNCDLITFLDTSGQKQVCCLVGSFIELLPGHLAAACFMWIGLDELVILPGASVALQIFRIQFHKTDVKREFSGISFKQISNRHFVLFLSSKNKSPLSRKG